MSKVNKLNSGKFKIQVYDAQGKRHRLTFSRKSEADAYIRKVEAEKHEQTQKTGKIVIPQVLVERAIEDFWLDKTSIRPKSVAKYKTELEQFQAFCSSRNIHFIGQFTRDHADEYRQLLVKTGAAPKTINSYLSRLRAVFTEQVNRDTISRNPTSHLKMVSLKIKTMLEREEEYYTEEEVKAFFKQTMDSEYRCAFLGLFLTGLRFEELANLTWDKIDFHKQMLMVRSTESFTTKTASAERDVALSQKLYALLQEIYDVRKSEYVFPSLSGQKLNERSLLNVCKRVAEQAKLSKNATLHKFRHTFSSLLSQYSIAYEVREYLLGHKPKGSLTAHYTKLNPAKLHYVVNILDDFLEGKNDN